MYDFGFGLSYSDFEYSNFLITEDTLSSSDTLNVEVFVTNDSDIDGYETIQLYSSDFNAFHQFLQPPMIFINFVRPQ